MISESKELSKRLDRILQMDSRESLLDEIEKFLEDTGLDEDAKRARLLDKMSEQLKVIVKHLLLVYAFSKNDPQNRDIPHWRDIELANAANEVVDDRNAIIANVKDGDVHAMLTGELNRSFRYVRRELKKYPQPFIESTFKTLQDATSPFRKFIDQFLLKLSSCHNEENVDNLIRELDGWIANS